LSAASKARRNYSEATGKTSQREEKRDDLSCLGEEGGVFQGEPLRKVAPTATPHIKVKTGGGVKKDGTMPGRELPQSMVAQGNAD